MPGAVTGNTTDRVKQTKDIVGALYDALNRGDLDAAAAMVADDVVFEVPRAVPLQPNGVGIEAWLDFRRRVVAMVPDLHLEIRRIIGSGDAVVVEGEHRSGGGDPVPFRHYLVLRDGKLAEFRESVDASEAVRWWAGRPSPAS